jgi:hypothetical protein
MTMAAYVVERGMTEAKARAAFRELRQEDKNRIMAQVERLMKYRGLSEGKSLAVLAAIGCRMIENPEEPWHELLGG